MGIYRRLIGGMTSLKVQYSLLKIQLDYIIQNNKEVDLTPEQKEKYKIKLADNQLFKLIRLEKGSDNAEELYKKQQEKKELKNNFTRVKPELSKLIDLLNDISEMEFIKELIFIEIPVYGNKKEINKNIDDIYRNGIRVDGVKFTRWGKSSSMTRHNIVCFIDDSINDSIYEKSMMGIKLGEVVIAKWEAYFNLVLSSCEFVEMPYTIVIDDYKHILPLHKVQFVVEKEGVEESTGKIYKYKDIEVIEKSDIEINAFDGEGICNKKTSMSFKKQLGLKYKPVAWVLRSPFIKGCVIEMDIQKYCEENGVATIKDYWGKEHLVSRIDMILTKSQFKGIEHFESWEDYLIKFYSFNHSMGITRYNKSLREENLMSRYNFQYLQTLNLGDKIIDLAKYSTDWAEKIIKGDKLYTLLFLGTIMKENTVQSEEENEDYYEVEELLEDSNKYIRAILLNDKMLQDTHIQNEYLYNMIRKYIREMKYGKIWISGKYEFLYADTYALLQHACGHKVTGLLKEGEHWSFNKSGDWVASRSPLMDSSEQNKMNFVNTQDTKKWFGHLNHGIMINIFGLDTMRMSDCDHDGDIIMTTNNPIVCNSVINDYPITMTKKTAKKEAYTIDNIIKADCIGFSNLIGKITNTMTTFINANTPDSYKNMVKRRIKLGRYFQGVEIDSCKLGVKEYMPKKWREQTRKLPYFLMYKYLYIKDKYDKVHREFVKSAKKKFQIPFTELFKYPDNDNIREFLSQYYRSIPVSMSKSPMNKLCHFIEAWENENFKLPYLKEYYDTTDIMTDKDIPMDSQKYKQIEQKYHEFMKEYNKGLRQEYSNHQWGVFYEKITKECLGIVPSVSELANIAVNITYKKYPTFHKKFVWVVASDGILKNLEKNRQSPIEVPVETGNTNDTEYLGRYYRLHEVDI